MTSFIPIKLHALDINYTGNVYDAMNASILRAENPVSEKDIVSFLEVENGHFEV